MIPRLPRGFTQPMLIGGGAFGTVVRARQVALDRWVAIKLVAGKSHQQRQALLKEARTQAAVPLDCIPQIFDAFEWAGKVCIVMQWIEGVSLRQLLDTSLSLPQRLWIAQGFVSALARLHGAGFAHRDLKPANILLSPGQGLVLIDFGFSRQTLDGEKSLAGFAKGTPAYMAPEVLHGSPTIDPVRADVFSAGVILREILQNTAQAAIVEPCLVHDPAARIASGMELLTRWQCVVSADPGPPDWRALAGPATAASLSRGLYRAARELLERGKDDQAYWLLVESVEQDADYEEALSLLNSFGRVVGRRRLTNRLLWAGGIAALLLIGVGLYEELSRRQSLFSAAIAQVGRSEQGTKIRPASTSQAGSLDEVRLREATMDFHQLVGRVRLTDLPAIGRLWIDNQPLDSAAARKAITLPFGEHLFAWRLEDGVTVWRERVMVLPFSYKRVNVWTAGRQ